MSIAVSVALIVSIIIYIGVGYRLSKKTKGLADLIPLVGGQQASVRNANEFSSSTVATTISLATIIVAYFELIPQMGLWLLWTVVTTALGIGLLAIASKQILKKMSSYDHKPSLHEFLGAEFSSPLVSLVGAFCTSVGFLLIFAVELTVGARFLAGLIPQVPQWITIGLLSFIGFLYTALGGFRAVIRTDYIQMRFIWLLIISLAVFIGVYIYISPSNIDRIPNNLYNFSLTKGIGAFLFGIAIMNIPTHVSNMSIWQRIAASSQTKTVVLGLWNSVLGSALSWGSLVLIAVLAFSLSTPVEGENFLITFLKDISSLPGGTVVIFCVALGLYGAMLSTASTQLIVVSHTIYEDIVSKYRNKTLKERLAEKDELSFSRRILLISAIVAVVFVEFLNLTGFSIADLVFAIYGGQLVLFPIILAALFLSKNTLKNLSVSANWAILIGFISGWGSAFIGKAINDSNMIFLAPAISIFSSSFILMAGRLIKSQNKPKTKSVESKGQESAL